MFFAVDRNLIAKPVYYGYARPGTSPIYSPNNEFFTADTFKTAFNLKKAAALLDAAGFPKKADGKRFTLNLLSAGWFAENGKIGAIVKQGLEDVGVGINLTVPDRPSSIKRIYTDYDFDLAIPTRPIRRSRCRPPRSTSPRTASRRACLRQRLGLPYRRGRRPGREDQGRDRSRQAQGVGR